MCGILRWSCWLSLLSIATLAGWAGCSKSSKTAPEAASSGVTEAARKKALSAKEAMMLELSEKLASAMTQGGPPAAIEVCSQEAPKVADRISKRFGVRIGRTSFKLRNPKNAPPEWARELVEKKVEEPTFLRLDDGTVAAWFPIRIEGKCMHCHGPPETLSKEVREQLAKLYPSDQATGFQIGDLRGWFWVEVPPKTAGSGDAS